MDLQRYPAIYENVFLTAWIDTDTCKEKVIAEKIDPETKERLIRDELECIHTAITEIKPEHGSVSHRSFEVTQ